MPKKAPTGVLNSKYAEGQSNLKWSPEARARRSEAAKKAAITRKANREKNWGLKPMKAPSYFQNSRVARWALSGVSVIAMMRARARIRPYVQLDNYLRG